MQKVIKFWSLKRVLFYLMLIIGIGSILWMGYHEHRMQSDLKSTYLAQAENASKLQNAIDQYSSLETAIADAKSKYPEIDLTAVEAVLPDLYALLLAGDFERVLARLQELLEQVNAKATEEQAKQELNGVVTYQNTGVASVDIQISLNGSAVKTVKTGSDGAYKTWLLPGKYSIKVSAAGYNEFSGEAEITAGTAATFNIALTKHAAAVVAKPKAVAVASTDSGIYSKRTIATERGTFTIHLLTVNLAEYQMIVDTAADDDCADNCPVLSLSDFVARNGGQAGIHGTYFCPTAYADCAGKTNSFYYKLHNGRLNKHINWSNGLGDYLPFFRVSSGGSLNYHSTWSSAQNLEMSTGISCRPHLVENGNIVLTAGDLDSEKESTYKMSHGFIGHIGQTVYVGVVLSANLWDSAAVSKALGLEDSFNLDGGGTTAMFYGGGYKIGPGRAMPNAIIFRRK